MIELKQNAPKDIEIVIVGNKYDIKNKIQVTKEEVNKITEEYNVDHFYTSAKTGKGIEELFKYLTASYFNLQI